MNKLTASERSEVRAVADLIVASLKLNNWNVLAWTASPLQSPRFAGSSVMLTGVPGRYNDMNLVKGNSNITIQVPNQGVLPSRVTLQELADLTRVVHGALAHECTHVLQSIASPATFAVAVALELQLRGTSGATQDDWFDLYVGQPLEQEARAVQAAAEVETLAGLGATRANFNAQLPHTEVWKRTALRVGGPVGFAAKVTSWWKTWAAMAYDAYV